MLLVLFDIDSKSDMSFIWDPKLEMDKGVIELELSRFKNSSRITVVLAKSAHFPSLNSYCIIGYLIDNNC